MGETPASTRASELARAARHERPFATLYAEHWRFVLGVLRCQGLPAHSVEDAAQEVFLILLARLSDLGPGSPLRAWLRSVALRVGSNHRRALRRRARWIGSGSVEPDGLADVATPRPDSRLERRELGARLEGALQRLTQAKRDVLVLALLEQHTASEIAALMRIPSNTVSSRLRAARLECARALGVSALDGATAAR